MHKLSKSIKIVLGLCLVMVLVHLANHLSLGELNTFGIIPRDLYSLPKIITAPFLHGDWVHLSSNLIGLGVFSLILLLRNEAYFFKASIFIILLTGLLVWGFARPGYHIGASGWIFGLWSLTIARALFEKSISSILIASAVILLYGGMVFGLLPSKPHISFEAHLFGAFAGVICAYLRIGTRRL